MANPSLIKTFVAGADVAVRRIVKFGAADGAVVQGAAVSDALVGVSHSLAATSGGMVDVSLDGIVDVDFGGTITRGGAVTSDANGKAVAAAPAAGTNNRIIGFAMVSGVSGDIGKVLLKQGQIQG